MNKIIYILAIVIPAILIFTLKSEKLGKDEIEVHSIDEAIQAADTIIDIIKNSENSKSEKIVEIRIVEKEIEVQKELFLDTIELEQVKKVFEEYKNFKEQEELYLKTIKEKDESIKELKSEKDSIENTTSIKIKELDRVSNEALAKKDSAEQVLELIRNDKSGRKILKRIQ
jgi:RNase adaptor protein for sRNA GlmZ degradation